jgi:hypothetical protein
MQSVGLKSDLTLLLCAVLFFIFDAAGFSLMAFSEVSSKVKYNSLRLASSDAIFVSLKKGPVFSARVGVFTGLFATENSSDRRSVSSELE